ncbi:hypothetical protein ABZ930_30965 [Streptomyces sp. NPDC046716]|uniref:hypothetical protein n=1 Tax=Streptomyces sp. NPDC046716 TaxID=3157093 RepID=UPI0033DC05BF
MFALAHAVVAHWWEEALHWEREEIWPRRLHRLAGGDAGARFVWWRITGRDAAIYPEVVTVAQMLLEPATAEAAWQASGAMHARMRRADDALCRQVGERVGRAWLGPLLAHDRPSPLHSWTGAVVRARRGRSPEGWRNDPWFVEREQQPATMAGGLRVLAAEARAGGSGTRWLAAVPAEQRSRITQLTEEACEQLAGVRGGHSGTTADVARSLLERLSRSADLVDQVVLETAAAAVAAGVALEDVAAWSRLPVRELAELLEGLRH